MKILLILGILLNGIFVYSQEILFTELDTQLQSQEKWKELGEIIKNKRIVALGENLHGVEEYNSTKIELIKLLHEKYGFNVIAIESDVARSYLGNLNRLQISDTTFLKELFSPVWHTEEYLEFVKYLKDTPNLKIIGFDVETKLSFSELAKNLKVQLDTTDTKTKSFQEEYQKWPEVNGRYRVIKGRRDSVMATIAEWIINQIYKNEKIIISANNAHISNEQINDYCMGEILKEKYQDDYYSIGFFHSIGNPKHVFRNQIYENEENRLPQNSIQAKFLETGKTRIFIDIKSQNSENWLFKELENVFLVDKYSFKMTLAESFDGIIWMKEVSHPEYVIKNKYLEK